MENKIVSTEVDFFEGPEKLLEIWFHKPTEVNIISNGDVKTEVKKGGLRSLPQKRWEEMLALVKCTILTKTSNEYFDAYVLSESSLFVWEQKIILKTCGTTLLLNAIDTILKLGRECGFTVIGDVFYSRRNFFAQPKQKGPHLSFDLEVAKLTAAFDGSAYILGKTNSDHWFLFLTDKSELIDNRGSYDGPLVYLDVSKNLIPSEPDFTLEILMTKLDAKTMEQFYKKDKTARAITESSGIAGLFPDAIIDDCLFDPCGYSMNGLLGQGYFTIHITPQPACSYVSFETNIHVSGNDYSSLVEQVLNVFKPGKFTITLFGGYIEDFSSIGDRLLSSKLLGTRSKWRADSGTHRPVYLRSTRATYAFENAYELVFAHYEHVGFQGHQTSSVGSKRKVID
jgi:S-adenosylmethionine decarboxylase